MRNVLVRMVAIALSVGMGLPCSKERNAPSRQDRAKTETKKSVYDGNWWLTREADEQTAFLEGAGDCLVWTAHVNWLTHYLDNLEQRMTRYYKEHPKDRGLPVTDVWRKLLSESKPTKPPPGGEEWTNPHGFLDGTWWVQSSQPERLALLEGYLWCMRTCVNQPSETYSRSADYYAEKIGKYILAHPKTAYDEAVATVLARYRDSK